MDFSLKIVTSLPLTQLWDSSQLLNAVRGPILPKAAIKDVMRAGAVQFVIADVGLPLRWIPVEERFIVWKRNIEPHVAEHDSIDLYAFPGGIAYVASEWHEAGQPLIILLEAHH